ncbi:MAG: hypothetical protein AAB596_02405 [Patescibacteria group bacterium]
MDNIKKKIKVVDIIPIQKESLLNQSSVGSDEATRLSRQSKESEKNDLQEKLNALFKEQKIIDEVQENKQEDEIATKEKIQEEIIEKEVEEFEKETTVINEEKVVEEPFIVAHTPLRKKIKKYLLISAFAIFLGSSIYGVIVFLPSVEIKIAAQKLNWNFNSSLMASKSLADVNYNDKQLPAEIFSEKRNLTMDYPASGKKFVKRKAGGEITIFNSYSSQPQSLVANTRFAAPDGKIFHLNNKIIVPGAKIESGKIIASSIKAKVTAAEAGSEYNISATDKFLIPGFSGSEKYQGFYASSNQSMTGGFIGELSYPTEQDLQIAKERTSQTLKESLTAFLTSQVPKEFKIIENSQQFIILKENSEEVANESGNFSITIEAELSLIVFRESDVLDLINNLAKQNLGDSFEPKEYKINYGASQEDFKNGKISFLVDYQGIFWKPINIDEFKKSIIGKKERELKIAIFSLSSGLEKATVSFWPFWVKKVPKNITRIKLEIE